VWDPNIPEGPADPGSLVLHVEVKPARFESLRGVVEDVRAAGVKVELVARYIFVKPRVILELRSGLTAAGKLKVLDQVIEALGRYLDELPTDQPATGEDMMKAITGVADVQSAEIVDVIVRRSDLSASTPLGEKIAARELLQNESGGPASDDDFGAEPTFQIVTTVDDSGGWFLVLDMEREDADVKEAS
jgi:hypothetical protein